MDERFKALEPQIREVLSQKYNRKLPPNLFDKTPPEQEKLKERYREEFDCAVTEYGLDDETDKAKIAESIAEYINEMISEEILNPCPEDWT